MSNHAMNTMLERTFEAAVSLQQAWGHLARIEAWPSWARHIRSIETNGPLSPETEGTIRLRNGVTSRFRMTELNTGRNWVWEGSFLWLQIRYDHVFEAVDDDRTQITFRVDGAGFGCATLGRLFAAIYARNLDRAIPRLVAELVSA